MTDDDNVLLYGGKMGGSMGDLTPALDWWTGHAGDEYTERNRPTPERIDRLTRMWRDITANIVVKPHTILEVGANVGANLRALRRLYPDAAMFAVEPNDKARAALGDIMPGSFARSSIDNASVAGADLIFTSGVLIHIPPDGLLDFCRRIHQRALRWIVAIEYFSAEPREVEYRGEKGRMWLRDFGGFWLDNFPDLRPVACGFYWSRLSGLDDVTYHLLERR